MAAPTVAAAPHVRFPRVTAALSRSGDAPARVMVEVGQMVWFALTAIGLIPFAVRRYHRELLRMVAQMGMGTGAMAVAGGTSAIVGFITLSAGSLVAIQGFASLGNIGVEAFTGFLAAMVNVRFVAPVAAGQALAATVGAGATAELGAMRISEEIVALVVMTTHCYYGYTAKGGPVGVGEAVGRSMRLSLITIVVVVVLTAMAVYGNNPNFNLTG